MHTGVAVLRCSRYDSGSVQKAVHNILELLGGIGRFVRNGQNVLLKPNMLTAKAPDQGATTHPSVLEAVVLEVQSAGGKVWIGDSPSAQVLKDLGIEEHPLQLRFAKHMNSSFDLPNPKYKSPVKF